MGVFDVLATLTLTAKRADVRAAAVTEALGIEPTRIREHGDPPRSRAAAARGERVVLAQWSYTEPRTIPAEEDRYGYESLVRLAERLEPHAETLRALSTDFELTIWMFGASDSWQTNVALGPDTMRRLGSIPAHFVVDLYVSDDSD